jgi:2,3-bisphosphoglycerate-dependent phosphoglycerate mutase
MAKTRIILTRHGETDWNAEARIQGHTDIALNATGVAQAEALGERLSREAIDVIYTSDLSRAERTAEAVRRRMPNVEFIRTLELRERNWGALEGMNLEEVKGKNPKDAETLKTGAADYTPEGGESKIDVRARVLKFLEKVITGNPGKTVLLVTHGGISVMMLRIVLGVDMAAHAPFRIDNCSVTVLDCEEKGVLVVKSLNCTCHLEKQNKSGEASAEGNST